MSESFPSSSAANLVGTRRFEDVAVVEMDRVAKKNAMDTTLLEQLVVVLEGVRDDNTVASIVITGAGGAFSSGADTSERIQTDAADHRTRLFARLYEIVSRFPKPTVAAIPGPAIGGGAELATSCDLRVGTGAASFRFPGAAFGIPVGTARLPLLIGVSFAKDLLMTSRTVGADEAFRMGLLNRLVEPPELEHEAVALAGAMGKLPGAITEKRLLDEMFQISSRVWKENRGLLRWQRNSRG